VPTSQNNNFQEEINIKKIIDLSLKNYKLFLVFLILAFILSAALNHFKTPVYKVSSSILIKEDNKQLPGQDVNNYLNSNLFRTNQNFQNELWILKSSPVLERTINNLDLQVSYYQKEGFRYIDAYKNVPFHILFLHDHIQPVGVRFFITSQSGEYFYVTAESKKASFYNFNLNQSIRDKDNWSFHKNGRFGNLIENADLAFIIELDTANQSLSKQASWYGFEFTNADNLKEGLKNKLEFNIIDKQATIVEISLRSESIIKGRDIVNELMNVYSAQNLDRKNHIASITIDYIEKQLNEISDSLNQTEDNLQRFRSSNKVLNINDQATGISAQYMNLQNQLAELITRKRYYDYVSDYISKNDNFSNMIVPASLGIQDQLLSSLMSELIAAQAQRSNLIENNQEKNPLVQKLGIQIENIKKTISENISAASRTTNISIDEMDKRIGETRVEISRLPETQRQLGSIERKYRLNDAIYNYMVEKRAEAKITKASNLPDDIIIEQAKRVGLNPVSPNKKRNYLLALFLGLAIPFGFVGIKSIFNNKIESQNDIERLTDVPVLGKILHNKFQTDNVLFEFPNSNISESFRVLPTNLNFYVRGGKKVIMVTSCMQGEGKSFVALNLAMSYAQLGRRTILVNFDLRKPKTYFKEQADSLKGLTSYLINETNIEEIITKSLYDKLDYICSGILPPNPVVLIALDKTKELLTKLKNDYDIIVLDTTPLGQVTDAYLLIDYAELKMIIVRQNFTLKNVFSLIMKDLQRKNIDNVCIVMNDNRFYSDQYGYGYGYNNDKGGRKRGSKNMRRMEKYYSA
jgi:tyrosine-protein kinase Etk/Wzc